MTWSEWIRKHSLLFGMTSRPDLEMLLEWSRLFDREEFCPDDLVAASEHVALHERPQYRSDQLPALLSRASVLRAARLTPASPGGSSGPGGPSCTICDAQGWAVVPHWRPEYRARRATCAVLCSCWHGRRLQQSLLGRPTPPDTLERYEQRVPDWREIMDRWKESERGLRVQGDCARALDQELGRITRTLGRMPK